MKMEANLNASAGLNLFGFEIPFKKLNLMLLPVAYVEVSFFLIQSQCHLKAVIDALV